MSAILSDDTRRLDGDGVGDLLARIANGFSRGTYDGVDTIRIEIDRNRASDHAYPVHATVRVRMWGRP